jgi:hypothetical protein
MILSKPRKRASQQKFNKQFFIRNSVSEFDSPIPGKPESRIWYGALAHLRMTENSRLAIAAAAIKQRIVKRSTPLVFLPVLPLKKGSSFMSDIVGG